MRLCRKYVFTVLSPLLINHTQKSNVLRPDLLEAKAKAAHRRGQGQGHKILSSRCPRGRGQSSRTPSLIWPSLILVNSFTFSPLFTSIIVLFRFCYYRSIKPALYSLSLAQRTLNCELKVEVSFIQYAVCSSLMLIMQQYNYTHMHCQPSSFIFCSSSFLHETHFPNPSLLAFTEFHICALMNYNYAFLCLCCFQILDF